MVDFCIIDSFALTNIHIGIRCKLQSLTVKQVFCCKYYAILTSFVYCWLLAGSLYNYICCMPILLRVAFWGMLMSAVSPTQIPFWFGWSTVLFQNGTLQPVKAQYNAYITGIGVGTMMGNCVFIFGGRLIVNNVASSQDYINWFIGGIFAVTAVIQAVKMLLHKDGISKMKEKNDLR